MLQIKNFAKIEYLTEFELTKHVGEHSILNFSAAIEDNAADSCLNCAGKTISVTTVDNAPIFFGRVESVTVEDSFGHSRVYASCISLSVTVDEQKRTRIFHDPDKKLSDVLSDSRLSLESCSLKLANEISAQKYSPVILQNQETNFQFITRLSENLGVAFWIIDTMPQPEILIDSCVNRSPRKLNKNQIISLTRTKSDGVLKTFIKTQTNLDLGQVVKIEGNTTAFVIIDAKIILEHEIYCYYYETVEHKPLTPKISDEPILVKTAKLHGKVKNTNDDKNLGRIQIDFDDKFVKDMDADKPLWIPYRTPYSGKQGGVVFIPDIGDAVEVFFVNGEIFCVSALRENPLDAECQKVAEKYIGNNTKQRIFWREKSLEFFSDKYKIVMNEQGVELTVGKNSITLTEQEITLKTADSKISLGKDVVIQSGGKLSTQAKETAIKSDGEISVSGNGTVNVAGGTIKLKGGKIEFS